MQYFMIAMIVIVFGIFLILMIENCRRVRDGKRLMREIDDLTQCGVHKAVAIKKAEALLRSICGEENYQEYMHHGGVSTNLNLPYHKGRGFHRHCILYAAKGGKD